MKRLSVLKFMSQETSKRPWIISLYMIFTWFLHKDIATWTTVSYYQIFWFFVCLGLVLNGFAWCLVLHKSNLSIKYVYCISVAGTALIKMFSLGTPCCPICFYGISNFNSWNRVLKNKRHLRAMSTENLEKMRDFQYWNSGSSLLIRIRSVF